MQTKLLQTFAKLLLFSGFTLAVSLAAKRISAPLAQQISGHNHILAGHGKKNVFFIGSSRVATAVNNALPAGEFPGMGFYNMAINQCTFLINAAIARKLMLQNDSITLFVELSIANAHVPAHTSLLLSYNDIQAVINPLIKQASAADISHIFLPLLENYGYDFLRLSHHIQLALRPASFNHIMGHQPFNGSAAGDATSVLTPAEVNGGVAQTASIPVYYKTVIDNLLLQAKNTGAKILFMLPVAIDDAAEKERLVAVYHHIPAEHKLVYPSALLQSLRNAAFLKDARHLNSKGAHLFTSYIISELRRMGFNNVSR